MCASRNDQDDIHAIRVAAGAARPRARLRPRRHRHQEGAGLGEAGPAPALVVNTAEVMPGEFTRNADFSLPAERASSARSRAAAGGERVAFRRRDGDRDRRCSAMPSRPTCSCSATPTRRAACRSRRDAIEQAIELNGEAVEMNLDAFAWGRRAAAEPERRRRPHGRAHGADRVAPPLADASTRSSRAAIAFLTDYQNAAYAERYRVAIERVREAEARSGRRARPRSPRRWRARCSSSWPTRTSTRSRGSTPTATSRSRSPRPSRARTCATSSTWRRRSSPAATRPRACRAR